MFYLSKQLKSFAAAHRLIKDYPGKCRDLHGHNYRVDVLLAADQLDHYDFVLDFDDIKQYFDSWLQAHWDHATLVSDADQTLLTFLQREKSHHFIITEGRNTTAEVLAEFLYQKFSQILASELGERRTIIQLIEVKVYESATAFASYRP